MKIQIWALIFSLFAGSAHSQEKSALVTDIVQSHILPGFNTLAATSHDLQVAAASQCKDGRAALIPTYSNAFDAWISVSHLRFGPTEVDDRAFALAFWPDSRGATPRSLAKLINTFDPVVASPSTFRDVSIAARGFYALEFLLYDDRFLPDGNPEYWCSLVQAITTDIDNSTSAILGDWRNSYAGQILRPNARGIYRNDDEALQELFKALSAGLQFTSETRLGRPLGTFDHPRPNRAEARRSGRALHHVELSVKALQDLSWRIATDQADIQERLGVTFTRSLKHISTLNDPIFANVRDVQGRLRVEILQQSIDQIRTIATNELGRRLGVVAGFNALDGD